MTFRNLKTSMLSRYKKYRNSYKKRSRKYTKSKAGKSTIILFTVACVAAYFFITKNKN
jgi:hypothetical protein